MNPASHAIMLLTVSFGKSETSGAKPLSTQEWALFASWLKDRGLDPSALLKGDLNSMLSGWEDRSITLSRIESLLDRGGALGLVLEKWQRAGLWAITRSDPDYPERLKSRLRLKAPPVLFGCGNKMLLGRGGIAVVGSRDADRDDIAFSEKLADAAAKQGYSIVSGGARGIDQCSMLSALQNEGTAIGIVADGLLREVTSKKYRNYLLSNDLVLITPFNPEAAFHVGNAMSRNRYIYCLADAAIVVSSTRDKGGTRNGALEDLKAAWVPLWVKRTTNPQSGNADLVQKGARWLPDDLSSFELLVRDTTVEAAEEASRPLPKPEAERPTTTEPGTESRTKSDLKIGMSGKPPKSVRKTAHENAADAPDFYIVFLDRMLDITADGPMKTDEIALCLELQKSQVSAWLKRGLIDGKIEKATKPVRYQSTENVRRQASLFAEDR